MEKILTSNLISKFTETLVSHGDLPVSFLAGQDEVTRHAVAGIVLGADSKGEGSDILLPDAAALGGFKDFYRAENKVLH